MLNKGGHDTASQGHDMIEQCCDTVERKATIRPTAHASGALLGVSVAIQSFVS